MQNVVDSNFLFETNHILPRLHMRFELRLQISNSYHSADTEFNWLQLGAIFTLKLLSECLLS